MLNAEVTEDIKAAELRTDLKIKRGGFQMIQELTNNIAVQSERDTVEARTYIQEILRLGKNNKDSLAYRLDVNGEGLLGEEHLPHQVCFLAWALKGMPDRRKGGLCFEGCGTGKTHEELMLIQAYTRLCHVKRKEPEFKCKPILLCAPKGQEVT